jgi:hypothetical protein
MFVSTGAPPADSNGDILVPPPDAEVAAPASSEDAATPAADASITAGETAVPGTEAVTPDALIVDEGAAAGATTEGGETAEGEGEKTAPAREPSPKYIKVLVEQVIFKLRFNLGMVPEELAACR